MNSVYYLKIESEKPVALSVVQVPHISVEAMVYQRGRQFVFLLEHKYFVLEHKLENDHVHARAQHFMLGQH